MPHPNAPGSGNTPGVAQKSEYSGTPPGQRGLRLASAPTVSIVVASVGPRAQLEACIAVLLPECTGAGVELVVVRSTDAEEFRGLQNRYRAALFMPAPDGSSLKVLRNFGLAAAEGDIVALVDDTCLPDEDWLRHLVALTVPGSTS